VSQPADLVGEIVVLIESGGSAEKIITVAPSSLEWIVALEKLNLRLCRFCITRK
jgi:hypothetical protein